MRQKIDSIATHLQQGKRAAGAGDLQSWPPELLLFSLKHRCNSIALPTAPGQLRSSMSHSGCALRHSTGLTSVSAVVCANQSVAETQSLNVLNIRGGRQCWGWGWSTSSCLGFEIMTTSFKCARL